MLSGVDTSCDCNSCSFVSDFTGVQDVLREQAANKTKRCSLTTERKCGEGKQKKKKKVRAVLSCPKQSNKPKARHHFRSERCMVLLPLHGALLLCHHRVAAKSLFFLLVPWTNNGVDVQRDPHLGIGHGEAPQPHRVPSLS